MSQELRKIISNNVSKYRKKCGYTREHLSLLICKDNSYISKLEKTKVNITIDTLEEISKVLNVSVIDLIN